MNCIYNVGRSNFYKYFKIYGEDGDMYPQVKEFIKKKRSEYIKESLMEADEIIKKNSGN